MYGLIGKITVVPGERDNLIALLSDGTTGMPGCLSYVVAEDSADENAIWVTEVWDAESSHRESLSLPAVQNAIRQARPLIAGFDTVARTRPLGGIGL